MKIGDPRLTRAVREGRAPADALEPGKMNATESRYNDRLYCFWTEEKITGFAFEVRIFPLAYRCTYMPDFAVIRADGTTEYHEVKGPHCWEDSWIKFKVCAVLNPETRFVWAQYNNKSKMWRFKVFDGGKPIKINDDLYK